MTEHHDEDMLVAINERTRFMAEDIKDTKRDVSDLRKETREAIQRVHSRLEADFVSQRQFWPVQALVYGTVALLSIGVLGALLSLVIRPP